MKATSVGPYSHGRVAAEKAAAEAWREAERKEQAMRELEGKINNEHGIPVPEKARRRQACDT